MDRNGALGILNKIHRLRDNLEKSALKLESAVGPLKRSALGHSARIQIGILAGIRRYLIGNEEEILDLLMKGELPNGKETLNKKHGKESTSLKD